METNIERTPSRSDITIYQTEDGISKVEVLIEGETVWLTQEQMAILYGKSKSTICEHIRNIYDEKELVESLTMHKFGKTEFMDKGSNFFVLFPFSRKLIKLPPRCESLSVQSAQPLVPSFGVYV